MERTNDTVYLVGEVAEGPSFSHADPDTEYYKFRLTVKRLSGAEDVLDIIAPRAMLEGLEVEELPRLAVEGEVRSYNNRSGVGPKLVISVLARRLWFCGADWENMVRLEGSLTKAPVYRRTPMGREICDMMLAVRRRYMRSDYLPVIAWGAAAREAAEWPAGAEVALTGRLQSRVYVKTEGDITVEKTAYEISAMEIHRKEEQAER